MDSQNVALNEIHIQLSEIQASKYVLFDYSEHYSKCS